MNKRAALKFISVVGMLLVFFGMPEEEKAQAIGDYRTFQTGNWSDVNSWSRWNGTSWVNPAPSAPASTDGVITILNGHTITVTSAATVDQVTIDAGSQVTVNGGVTLKVANSNITVGDTSSTNGNSNSFTFAHDGSGISTLLLVGIARKASNATVTSVTYAGVAMTAIPSGSFDGNPDLFTYYLVNPTTGVNNIVVTCSAATETAIGAVTYSGVDQSTPLDTAAVASGSSGTASVNVSSASGDLVQDFLAVDDGPVVTVGAGQTSVYDDAVGGKIRAAGSIENGATTVTMSWTFSSKPWAICGVSINPAAAGAAATKQYIIGNSSGNPSNAATRYASLSGLGVTAWASGQADQESIISTAGKLSNFQVGVVVAPGAGKSWAFTIQKGTGAPPSDTALSVNIADTATRSSIDSDEVTVAAGDRVVIKVVPTSSPTAPGAVHWSVQFTPTTPGETIFLGNTNGTNPTANYFIPITGSKISDATEFDLSMLIPTAGILKNLFVQLGAAPGATNSRTFTVNKNTVATSLATTIADTAVSNNNVANFVAVSAGDKISIKHTVSGSSPSSSLGVSLGLTLV